MKKFLFALLIIAANCQGQTLMNPYVFVNTGPSNNIEDNFNATNTSSISGRTPSPTTNGNNWYVGGTNSIQLSSNRVSPTASNTENRIYIQTGSANGTITQLIQRETSVEGSNSIIFRATDDNNLWLAHMGHTGYLELYSQTSGSYSSEASSGQWGAFESSNAVYMLKVVYNGDQIDAYLMDATGTTTILTASKNSNVRNTATIAGIRFYPNVITNLTDQYTDDWKFVPF